MFNSHRKTVFHAPHLVLNPGNPACNYKVALHANNIVGRLPMNDRLPGRSFSVFMDAGVQRILLDVAVLSKDHTRIFSRESMWFVKNLSSHGGTSLNGRQVSGRPAQISNGDTFFAGPVPLGFYLAETEREIHNGALLVGNPGKPPLAAVKNDLDALKTALMARKNFSGNIITLFRETANKAAVIAALERLSGVLSESSTLLFYFSGHGQVGGLCLSDGLLGPAELYPRLSRMRGHKVILLDCCHSISFAHAVASDMLLIQGDSPSHEMFEGKATVLGSVGPFGKREHGYLTRAFVNVLEQEGGRIALKQAVEILGQYHRLKSRGVEVMAEGDDVIFGSVLGIPPPIIRR